MKAKELVQILQVALYHIDAHKMRFSIPKLLSTSERFNRYQELHHKKPILSSETLIRCANRIIDIIHLPFFVPETAPIFSAIVEFAGGLEAFGLQMNERTAEASKRHHSLVQIHNPEENWQLLKVPLSSPTPDTYKEVENALNLSPFNFPIDLSYFAPQHKVERHRWISNLKLSCQAMLWKFSFGNYLGTLWFIWKVEMNQESELSEGIARELLADVPIFHTRAMRAEFYSRYVYVTGISKAIKRNIYIFLSGDSSALPENSQRIDDIIELFLHSGDPDLILDMRAFNARPQKFDSFWNGLSVLLDEFAAPNDRRHGVSFFSQFISIRDLIARVRERFPDIKEVPSETWVSFFFFINLSVDAL